jgi:hypothetical protein
MEENQMKEIITVSLDFDNVFKIKRLKENKKIRTISAFVDDAIYEKLQALGETF